MKYNIFENGGNLVGNVTINGLVMTGKLKLHREATEPNEAVNKDFVDEVATNLDASKIISGTVPVERFPGISGDVVSNAGSGIINLKNTGVTPGSYTKVTVNNSGLVTSGTGLVEADIPGFGWEKIGTGKPFTLSGYGISNAVNRNSGVVNGNIVLSGEPTDPEDLVTKAYADNVVSGNVGFSAGDIISYIGEVTPTGFLRCNGGQVSKTMYPELYSILLNSVNTVMEMSYTSHSAMGGGKPWKNQYDFNNYDGDITGWSTGTSLPVKLGASQAIVTKNRVYLLGGIAGSGTAVSTVYTAPINEDGTLGTWTTGTSLPSELYYSQAIVTKNRVYLLGGFNNRTVYTAPINEDGTLGAWTTGTSLPGTLAYSQAIVTKNRVYLLGGYNGSSYVATVYTAPINEDGTLGVWTTATSLPVPLGLSQAIITKNRVYLLGGISNGGTVATVYTAPINEDGTLGAWTTGTSLPGALGHSQAIVTKDRVYLLSGWNSYSYLSTVYTAPINEDGTIGTWTTGTPLPGGLVQSQSIVTKNRVYLLGGYIGGNDYLNTVYVAPLPGSESLNDYSKLYDGTVNKFDGTSLSGVVVLKQGEGSYDRYVQPGAGKPWKQQYEINTSQNTNITGWTTGTNLPGILYRSQAVVTKNRVYLLGGDNGSTVATVYTAPINEDGTLGAWTTGTSLPVALGRSQAIVTKNRVYLLGGAGGTSGDWASVVYTAPINQDGTLGAWSNSGNDLPEGLGFSQAIVTKNRVYLLGGLNVSGQHMITTYTAPINEDGTLGAWTTGANLLEGLGRSQVIVTNNRVYLLGGVLSNSYHTNKTYTAPINEDGTLGAWTTGANLPKILIHSQAIVTRDKVFLIGGQTSSDVYMSPIKQDGTLGDWVTCTSLPREMTESQVIITKNKIHILAIKSGNNILNLTYTASFYGGLNDYTSYYDGSITPTLPNNFSLPDYSSQEHPGSMYIIKH